MSYIFVLLVYDIMFISRTLMTKSFSKMENREEVAKQSLSLQILGAQLLVQVGLPLHNMFQLLDTVKIRILSHEKVLLDLQVRSAHRQMFNFPDLGSKGSKQKV